MAEKLTRRHSHRLQGLTPHSPPAMEGQEGVTMERPALVDARIETTSPTRHKEEFFVYNNPLVQLSPITDTTFHFPMEGQPDSSDWIVGHPPDETTETKYGPNDPFWRTPLGQTIARHGLTTTEPDPYMLAPLRNLLSKAPLHDQFLYDPLDM